MMSLMWNQSFDMFRFHSCGAILLYVLILSRCLSIAICMYFLRSIIVGPGFFVGSDYEIKIF